MKQMTSRSIRNRLSAARRAVATAFAFAFFAACVMPGGAPAVAASNVKALPDCEGAPVVKPQSVVLTCADAGFSVSHLTWAGWGESFAAGMGIASVNDCTPNCAAGHFHAYRVVLIANGSARCPSGQTAYARLTYAWIGRSPYAPDPDPTVPFPCGKRR